MQQASSIKTATQDRGRSNFVEASPWLFPGDDPGRPLLPGSLTRKLREHGIAPRAGRNTGLVALAADLPPAVLADVLGLHVSMAVRWSSYIRRDWNEFLTACTDAQMEANP
ncbi:hypothetical protein [Lentzea guizhouensis]|uniref:hypothetical protein n=1 Tax=Lentzea guizhouensis TaxID=1586287 RepID=UPI0012B68E1E|nr:hypothetical protein [Lentzea guizhouensis]